MALDATPKGAAANSYVTRAEANAYFADRAWASAWASATDATKDAALISATDRLDVEWYAGRKTNGGFDSAGAAQQALQWPRAWVEDRDGFWYDQNFVPAEVKEATYLLALEIVKSDTLKESALHNFESLTIGPLSITPRQPQ